MSRLINALKKDLIAGMLVILPAGLTVWLVIALWRWVNQPIYALSSRFADPAAREAPGLLNQAVRWCLAHGLDFSFLGRIPGLGLLVVAALIFLVGMAARSLIGRSLIGLGERIVKRVPVVGSVYAALKQLMEAVLSGNAGAFREAVLIEYPRAGLWTVAFVTGKVPPPAIPPELATIAPADEIVYCFVPTTPLPTNGILVILPRSQTLALAISVDEAIKLVVSGGIVSPRASLPPPARAKKR